MAGIFFSLINLYKDRLQTSTKCSDLRNDNNERHLNKDSKEISKQCEKSIFKAGSRIIELDHR